MCHCPSLTAHPEVVLLWDLYEPSSPPSCGVCLAPGAERCVTAGRWRWWLQGAPPVDTAQQCRFFSYPLPSQQFQQYVERLVLRSVEETLRVLLQFLALAKAQGHLVLLALEIRRWAYTDLGWQPQPSCGLLEALLVGTELRIPRLAQHAAYALQLLWAGKLRLGKQGWHTERLQQGSRGAGVALAYLIDIRDKSSRPIGANSETSEEPEQRLTVLCGIRTNPQG